MRHRITFFQILLTIMVCFPLVLAAATPDKGWLGVSVREMTPSLRDKFKLEERSGLLIQEVVRNSPADDAGLWEDDVILKFDGVAVEEADEFARRVRETAPGKSVTLLIFRDGEEKELAVEIAKRRSRISRVHWGEPFAFRLDRPRIGVQVHELNADLAPYFKVEKKGGVLISEVMEDSPAQQAGLKAGDVITKIHDQKISDPEDLFDALDGYEGGDKITVEYIRKGAAGMLEVELDDTGFREFRIRGRHRDNLRILHLEDMPRIPASPRSPVIINDHRRPGYSI